jgi:hypothetical protein
MNFFGHAFVAGWLSEREPFILGAMLPDLASVLRVSVPTSSLLELSAGIEFHHATDRAFHAAEVFRALEQQARLSLAAAGLPKGARRALAHIGVEFLIDAELAGRAPGWTGYVDALRFGSSDACGSCLRWAGAGLSQRFATLCLRLGAATTGGADTGLLVQRLVAALAGRPRLELQPEQVPLLGPWLGECRPEVARGMPELLAELARELGVTTGASLPCPPSPAQ